MTSSSTVDERVKRTSILRRALIRPELGAMGGTIAVFIFFLILAGDTQMFALEGVLNWSTVSAQFIILAVGVALLMITGEFDLSLGSMVGFFWDGVWSAGHPRWFFLLG
jgi:simple sugar transport system permease protein